MTPPYSASEMEEAGAAYAALVRATIAGDYEGIEAILGHASARELRAITEVILYAYSEMLPKLRLAISCLPSEERAIVLTVDGDDILATSPGMREAITANIAAVQARMAGG